MKNILTEQNLFGNNDIHKFSFNWKYDGSSGMEFLVMAEIWDANANCKYFLREQISLDGLKFAVTFSPIPRNVSTRAENWRVHENINPKNNQHHNDDVSSLRRHWIWKIRN